MVDSNISISDLVITFNFTMQNTPVETSYQYSTPSSQSEDFFPGIREQNGQLRDKEMRFNIQKSSFLASDPSEASFSSLRLHRFGCELANYPPDIPFFVVLVFEGAIGITLNTD